MSILLQRPAMPGSSSARVSDTAAEFLVGYGKNGAFGRFAGEQPLRLVRGDRVVVHSPRGQELGQVLCPATPRHAMMLTQEAVGQLLRPATVEDLALAKGLTGVSAALFDDSRRLNADLHLPLEILDVEVLLDGRKAVLQFLAPGDVDVSPLADALAQRHDLLVFFENLALPASPPEPEHAGCGKPDCGKTEGGGGCTSCSTGGGCSSCGSGKVDMTAYFGHLRKQMEKSQRVPLA